MPLVSIVIPCFNAGKLLQETLDSVLPLLGKEVEVVVVNDGSTDPITLEILQRHANSFCVLNTENKGLSAARNAGIRQAKGKFIFPLDADDLMHPAFISAACTVLEQNPNVDVVAGDYEKFGAEIGKVVCRWDSRRQWYVNGITASSMFRKSMWEELGGYDEQMKEGYEDWEFWLAALAAKKRFEKLDLLAFYYRIRPNSMVRSMSMQLHERLLAYMHQKHHAAFLAGYIQQQNALHELNTDYRQLLNALFRLVVRKMGLGK
jgi:glycosyltransferase involved in cell wall biosynthesis